MMYNNNSTGEDTITKGGLKQVWPAFTKVSFSHFSGSLHNVVLYKFATSSMRIKNPAYTKCILSERSNDNK